MRFLKPFYYTSKKRAEPYEKSEISENLEATIVATFDAGALLNKGKEKKEKEYQNYISSPFKALCIIRCVFAALRCVFAALRDIQSPRQKQYQRQHKYS